MYNVENIIYNGKTYTVTSPGKLIYNTNKVISKREDKCMYQILDQLNNLSYIGNKRAQYLKLKYNISELDYYIIVVLRGDSSKLPTCKYINPISNECCSKPVVFRSLVPRVGNIFFCSCREHVNKTAQ